MNGHQESDREPTPAPPCAGGTGRSTSAGPGESARLRVRSGANRAAPGARPAPVGGDPRAGLPLPAWLALALLLLAGGLAPAAIARRLSVQGPAGQAGLPRGEHRSADPFPGPLVGAPGFPAASRGPADPDRLPQDAPVPERSAEQAAARQAVLDGFLAQGLRVDLDQGWVGLEARVLARYQPLEYVLVGPRGQGHESLFGTEVKPSALNAALLLLGTAPGQNARWIELPPDADPAQASPNDGQGGPGGGGAPTPAQAPSEAPAPSEEPLQDVGAAADEVPRRPRFRIELPSGDGLFLYAAWRSEGEAYFFRVEDLLANVRQERAMRRHRFVYLGSRWVEPKPGAQPAFAADLEQNLINLVFFSAGNTLLTAAVREAENEEAWFANPWLLPESDQPVLFLLSRRALETLPPVLAERLPESLFPSGDS